MSGEIALRPSYWASVSGGKDSKTKWLKKLEEKEQEYENH